jgi:hypothetical protein
MLVWRLGSHAFNLFKMNVSMVLALSTSTRSATEVMDLGSRPVAVTRAEANLRMR